jgi:hypothetical protein
MSSVDIGEKKVKVKIFRNRPEGPEGEGVEVYSTFS